MKLDCLIQLSIQSDLKILPETTTYIVRILKRKNIFKRSDEYFYIELILSELISNAIIHGNKNDKRKTVNITVYLDHDFLVIEISDEGEIFDIKLPSKLNPLSEFGKGLYLVKKLVDEINIKKDDRKKIIIKKSIKNSESVKN